MASENREDTVGELVNALRADGRLESDGRFTVDPELARQKMRRFQLADPHRYILNLVAAAVSSGAQAIEVSSDRRECALAWNGRPLRRDELENLFSSLLISASDPASKPLRELAIGVNGALGLDPLRVEVESGDGRSGARLVVTSAAHRVESLTSEAATGTRVRVCKRRMGWSRTRPAEDELVERHCHHAAVSIRINGREVTRSVDFTGAAGWSHLEGPEATQGIIGVGPARRTAPSPGPFTAMISVGRNHSVPELLLVLDGVGFLKTPAGLPPGRAVIYTSRLDKDLSQSEVVENTDYEALLRAVRDELCELVYGLSVAGEYPDRLFPELLKQAARWFRCQGRLREALWLGTQTESPAGLLPGDSGPVRSQIATLAHRLGDRVEPFRHLRLGWEAAALARCEMTLQLDAGEPPEPLGVRLIARRHPELLDIAAATQLERGWFTEALELFESNRAVQHEPARVAHALEDLAVAAALAGEVDAAVTAGREALEWRGRAHPPGDARTSCALSAFGLTLLLLGQLEDAAGTARQALALATGAYGERHPETAAAHNLEALILAEQGDAPAAVAALALSTAGLACLGERHRDLATTLELSGRLRLQRGEATRARAELERCLQVLTLTLGPHSPRLVPTMQLLAELSLAEGDAQEAERLVRRALGFRDLPKTAVFWGPPICYRGWFHPDAGPELVRPVAFPQLQLGREGLRTAALLRLLASAYRAQGKPSRAHCALQRALAWEETRASLERHGDGFLLRLRSPGHRLDEVRLEDSQGGFLSTRGGEYGRLLCLTESGAPLVSYRCDAAEACFHLPDQRPLEGIGYRAVLFFPDGCLRVPSTSLLLQRNFRRFG